MTFSSTSMVDTEKVQKILEKFGTTFECPVNLENFAKEISDCCVSVSYCTTPTAFEESHSYSN
jgi:hypothetical protein